MHLLRRLVCSIGDTSPNSNVQYAAALDGAIQHLGLIGNLQKELITLQGGNANGPFVTAENIANATQKVTETLGFKSPGMFFQPPERVAIGAKAEPEPSVDPAVTVAQAQIEIARQAAAADADIKRMKAAADIEIAQWKARQWAEIERYKVGLKAEVDAISNAAADPAASRLP